MGCPSSRQASYGTGNLKENCPGKNDVKIAKIYLSGIKLKIHDNFVSGFFDLAEEINH